MPPRYQIPGQKTPSAKVSPVRSNKKKLIATTFQNPSGLQPYRVSPNKTRNPPDNQNGQYSSKDNRNSQTRSKMIDNKMVNIELEQRLPDDVNSYYSSLENTYGKPINKNGTPGRYNAQGQKLKEDPEPEPTRPMNQNFMQTQNYHVGAAFVDEYPNDISNSTNKTNKMYTPQSDRYHYMPSTRDRSPPQEFHLDQMMQEREERKKMETKNQYYVQKSSQTKIQDSQTSFGSKKSIRNSSNELVNRLSKQSPRRFSKNTLDYRNKQYDFKPQICKKSVQLVQNQVENGKFGENVNNVYDHLARDVNEREARQHNRMNETRIVTKQNQRVIAPNNKSNNILADKFRDEFEQAIQTLSKPANSDLYAVEETHSNSEVSFVNHDRLRGISETLNFQQTRNILFCLGFTKQLEGIMNIVTSGKIEKRINPLQNIWVILEMTGEDPETKRGCIKTVGLFNFLCYLQSIEFLVQPNEDSEEVDNVNHNKYGYCLNGKFFIKSPAQKRELIKDFYDLLNNKKTFDRNINAKANQIKTKIDMRANETFKPAMAPKTSRHISVQRREQLSRIDYSNALAARSTSKLDKLYMMKQENQRKIDKQCTFVPKINLKISKHRDNSNSTGRSNGSKSRSNNGSNRDPSYVDNYLYKPKQRRDKTSQDIEFESQRKDCSFKPKFKNTKTIATSKIKLYIDNNDNSIIRKNATTKNFRHDRMSQYSGQKSPTQHSRGSSIEQSVQSDKERQQQFFQQNKFRNKPREKPSSFKKQQKSSPQIAREFGDVVSNSQSSNPHDPPQLSLRPVILQMEVMISKDHLEYLVVLKGDNYIQVVSDFVARNGLSSSKHNKLLSLVENNIQQNQD